MRLHVVFTAPAAVFLPWHYLHLLHGFLYAAIARASPEVGGYLHNHGYASGAHRYKMLVFSRLYPRRAVRRPEGLELEPPIHWWVSSPLASPMEALATSLLTEGRVVLGEASLEVEKLEVEPLPEFSGRVRCETLSPLVASTGVQRGEKLHKKFLSPGEPIFWQVLEANLRRKAEALGMPMPAEVGIRFTPLGEWRSRLLYSQGTQVRGYEGRFIMEGHEPLLRLAYEAGLGERNTQGFGMFRVIRSENRGEKGSCNTSGGGEVSSVWSGHPNRQD
jgi:CRISPR-associated endoribonuclease Cas6